MTLIQDDQGRMLTPFVWFTSDQEGATRIFYGLAADICDARRRITVDFAQLQANNTELRSHWVETFVFFQQKAWLFNPSDAFGLSPDDTPTLPGGEELVNAPLCLRLQ